MEKQPDRTGWIQLISGKPFYPLNPVVEDIEIHDIAWALSMQCRYTGHVRFFYSVAEHCVHLSFAAPAECALWSLLHDAGEAYLVDLARPVKQQLPQYQACEDRLMKCIAQRFSLSWPEPAIVKELDTRILFNERQALLNPSVQDWCLAGEPIPNLEIQAWQPQEAYDRFMARYWELMALQEA